MKTLTWINQRSPSRDTSVIKCAGVGIAAYVISVGLGIVRGFDVPALFSGLLAQQSLAFAGQGVVVFCGLMLLCGAYCRPAAVALAVLILSASGFQNLSGGAERATDAFAADLVLIFGLLACFWPLRQDPTKSGAPVQHQSTGTAAIWPQPQKIVPRRVVRPASVSRQLKPQIFAERMVPTKANSFEEPDLIMNRLVRFSGAQKHHLGDVKSIYA